MRCIRVCLALLVLGAIGASVRAQDVEPESAARRLFEEGVQLSEGGAWQEATARFEASLALADRPGTRFNLIRAYAELHRSLDVARHAVVFLALPAEPHRADARAATEALLSDAARSLATLVTDSLPAGCNTLIDGQAPVAHDGTRVFVLPGLHRLEAGVPGGPSEIIEIQLLAGQTLRWPRSAHSEVVIQSEPSRLMAPVLSSLPAPEAPARSEPSALTRGDDVTHWRKSLAWTAGTVGAGLTLAAVGTYAITIRRQHTLPSAYESGFLSASDRYLRTSNAVIPLAVSGALVMASAVLVGEHSSHWGSRATAATAIGVGAALLAAGLVLVIPRPGHVNNTNLDEPSRQLGALIASGAGPLLSYGLSAVINFRRDRHGLSLSLGERR
jgi:hypothetical protein